MSGGHWESRLENSFLFLPNHWPPSTLSFALFSAVYIIFNLGISKSFGNIEFNHINFPTTMSVDWGKFQSYSSTTASDKANHLSARSFSFFSRTVRVYQPTDAINVGCNPDDYPTTDYIARHPEAYSNAQFQFWGGSQDAGGEFSSSISFLWCCSRLLTGVLGCLFRFHFPKVTELTGHETSWPRMAAAQSSQRRE